MVLQKGAQDLTIPTMTIQISISILILNHGVGFSIHLKPQWPLSESYPNFLGVGTNIGLLFVNISLSQEQLA